MELWKKLIFVLLFRRQSDSLTVRLTAAWTRPPTDRVQVKRSAKISRARMLAAVISACSGSTWFSCTCIFRLQSEFGNASQTQGNGIAGTGGLLTHLLRANLVCQLSYDAMTLFGVRVDPNTHLEAFLKSGWASGILMSNLLLKSVEPIPGSQVSLNYNWCFLLIS